VETAGVFLEALASKDNTDPNKVRGLKNGILVHNRDTGMPMHVLLNQYLLYRGDTKHYFPNNNLTEKSTANEIGGSLYAADHHRAVRLQRLRPKPQKPTNITSSFPYTGALMKLMLMILLLES